MFNDRSRGVAAQTLALLPSDALARLLHAHFADVVQDYSTDSNSLFHLFCDEDQTALAALLAQLLLDQESFGVPVGRNDLYHAALDELRQALAADGWTLAGDVLTFAPVDTGLTVLNAVVTGLADVGLDSHGRLADALRAMHRAFAKKDSAAIEAGCSSARRALDELFEQAAAAGADTRGLVYTHQSTSGALATLRATNVLSTADVEVVARASADIQGQLTDTTQNARPNAAQRLEHMVLWTCGYVASQFAAIQPNAGLA